MSLKDVFKPFYSLVSRIGLILGLLLMLFSCKPNQETELADQSAAVEDVTGYVNPFIGTAPLTDPEEIGYTPPEGWRVWAGLTYPGSSLPNAMVQLSPVTEFGSGAGYEYEDTEILSFAHTNKGHWNLVHIPILPVWGNAGAPFKSTFSHDREAASPGYYEVYLEDYDVEVRLTSTLRTGIHEYSFGDSSDRKILFNLGKANNGVSDWNIEQEAENVIIGFQRVGSEIVHFHAELSHPVMDLQTQQVGQANGYALASIADQEEGPVTMKIGISFVSTQNAADNLKAEVGDASFDEIHNQAEDTWRELLSTIEVAGGSDTQNEMFYSSFYRSFLWPALRSDINGEFRNVEGDIESADFRYYTNPAFWDTYRNKLVLMTIVSPEVTTDVIKSLINQGEKTGFIPTFFHGDHAQPFIAGAYLRGVRGFDVEKAYELLLNNAYKEGGVRPHIAEYIEKGFISDPDIENPHVETKAKAGVSKTLEYALDDYSLSLLASELGDTQHAEDLAARSKNYKNVFDTKTNFMRGRLESGDWISPFNPEYPYYEYMYREGNAWQLSFYVPHDMPGLVELYGGAAPFEAKLDSLFTLPWNPDHIARNVSSFIGNYVHGNQPNHEAPFSYYFVDKPEKSQAIIDTILEDYYGRGEHGLALAGMDDAGEMSSWYVFSAMGLYPLSPADTQYIVSVPVFDQVKWKVGDSQLLIEHQGEGRDLQEIRVNGEVLDSYFISHDLFTEGGELIISTQQ